MIIEFAAGVMVGAGGLAAALAAAEFLADRALRLEGERNRRANEQILAARGYEEDPDGDWVLRAPNGTFSAINGLTLSLPPAAILAILDDFEEDPSS